MSAKNFFCFLAMGLCFAVAMIGGHRDQAATFLAAACTIIGLSGPDPKAS